MLYSSSTAAAKLGCCRETVRRLAKKLKVGEHLPTGLVLADSELAQIKTAIRPIGNPKMVSGNQLWRRRQKSGKRIR